MAIGQDVGTAISKSTKTRFKRTWDNLYPGYSSICLHCRGVYIVFAVGESVALVRALRVVLLGKHKSRPTWDKLLVVMILESLHVTGTLQLHFVVQGVPSAR